MGKGKEPISVRHYIYYTPLHTWGGEKPGGQEVTDRNPAITEADMTPEEAKDKVTWRGKKILEKPELYPAGLKGSYINTHKSARNKEYTYDEFNRKFRKNDFYKVVTKGHKLENP